MDLHVFRIHLLTRGTVRFPAFPGPALRGALGDSPDVYAQLFAPPPALPQKRFADPPRPVTLRPRFGAGTYGPDSALELELTLVGSAGAALPAMVRALVRLGEQGIGEGRRDAPDAGRFTLERVDAMGPAGSVPVVTPGGLFRPVRAPWRFPVNFAAADAPVPPRLRLEFVTPTFVNRRDQPRGTLAFADLVDDLLRRVSLLSQAYGDGTPVHTRDEERALLDVAVGCAPGARRHVAGRNRVAPVIRTREVGSTHGAAFSCARLLKLTPPSRAPSPPYVSGSNRPGRTCNDIPGTVTRPARERGT